MDNWDDLRFLVALSKTGTMTAAAKHLGTNTATVSRRIERLSEQLGTPAFVKTTEGWKPSEAVMHLIEISETFDGTLQSALNSQAARMSNEPVKINIGSIPVVTSQVLIPGLQRRSSQLSGISLTFTDRVFREGLGENDVVVMYGQPESGRIVTRKAGHLSFRLYRNSDRELDDSWAGLGEAHDQYPPMRMGFDQFAGPPKVRVDSFLALYGLMQSTGLPGPLPDLLAAQDVNLVPVTPGRPPFLADFWLMFHETRRSDPAMRSVVEWITACFEDITALEASRTSTG
ncbi:DNA-binding transcriptional activator AllS [Roseivivax jejudonensis]|uniref:DNA-binding transcriptional activator AllS n=1 Tax=Roseivivax jejudonensis TaxID=1529041 RepID=A0A1X6Z3I4_9RHOB|nr:LysR family transcriptional regulator [Roseivivax jejudonensis]SLN39431.1 DNA-binding transcriptional activator AllS [Roseivivax jejudonensis]